MFGMVIERIFIPGMSKITGETEKKIVAVGMSKLLCECPAILTTPYRNYWSPILQALIQIFEITVDTEQADDELQFAELEDLGYQAAYSQLNYARPKEIDSMPNVSDGRRFIVESLAKFSCTRPGDVPTMIAGMPSDHQQALQKYCAQAGVQIV